MTVEVRMSRREVISRANIGVHHQGLYLPSSVVPLRGRAATVELDRDMRRFGYGDKGKSSRAYKVITAEYVAMVKAALGLHPEAILASSDDGAYDASRRDESFYNSYEETYLMNHDVLVPFSPGGHMKLMFELEGDLKDLEIGLSSWQDYFPGDKAGMDADSCEHDERNLECKLVIDEYLLSGTHSNAGAQ